MRFECQAGCTECCRRKGFVYLAEEDVRRIAAFLGIAIDEFERSCLYRTKHQRRLRTLRGTSCRFLEPGGCSIHPVKPAQCRIFPFWPELVEDKREWLKTAAWCPGIGKGPLISIESARAAAAQMREAYPSMYR
jgi:uncharacterized protein